MLRLNIRQTMTRIGIRTELSTLSSHSKPAEAHTEYVAPRSNKGTTQPQLSINSYPSRHAYGNNSNDDLTRDAGQRGVQEMRAGMARRNQLAQSMVKNAARPGVDEVSNQARQLLSSIINKQRQLVVQAIPDPEIHYTPCQAVGETDTGKYDWTVSVDPNAEVQFNRGRVETYIAQKGSVQQWTTEGHYDIYA